MVAILDGLERQGRTKGMDNVQKVSTRRKVRKKTPAIRHVVPSRKAMSLLIKSRKVNTKKKIEHKGELAIKLQTTKN